jgi:hypothetical protein
MHNLFCKCFINHAVLGKKKQFKNQELLLEISKIKLLGESFTVVKIMHRAQSVTSL